MPLTLSQNQSLKVYAPNANLPSSSERTPLVQKPLDEQTCARYDNNFIHQEAAACAVGEVARNLRETLGHCVVVKVEGVYFGPAS